MDAEVCIRALAALSFETCSAAKRVTELRI